MHTISLTEPSRSSDSSTQLSKTLPMFLLRQTISFLKTNGQGVKSTTSFLESIPKQKKTLEKGKRKLATMIRNLLDLVPIR